MPPQKANTQKPSHHFCGSKCISAPIRAKFQLWQAENHPIELATQKIAWQKLDYTHYNPIEAGFVRRTTDWKYSSTIDYGSGKGLLDVMLLDPMII